jgi:hypothetical protein
VRGKRNSPFHQLATWYQRYPVCWLIMGTAIAVADEVRLALFPKASRVGEVLFEVPFFLLLTYVMVAPLAHFFDRRRAHRNNHHRPAT